MQKMRPKISGLGILPACGIGIAVSLLVTVLIAWVTAIFISNEYFEINTIVFAAIVSQFLATFIGAFLVGKITDNNKMLTCCLAGGLYYLLLIGTAMLFFDGISGKLFVGLISCALGCFAGILTSSRQKKRSGRTRKGKRNR